MDFPLLDVIVSNVLLNFEADNPSIQKISLVDNTNYNPSYTTSIADPPTTKSFYTRTAVLFDSADPIISFPSSFSNIFTKVFLL